MVFNNCIHLALNDFLQTYGDQEILNSADPMDKRQYLNVDLKTIGLTNRDNSEYLPVTDRNDDILDSRGKLNRSPF